MLYVIIDIPIDETSKIPMDYIMDDQYSNQFRMV